MEELTEASKVFSQDNVQQHFGEQTIETPAASLAEMIVEALVIQTPERTQQSVNTYVQHAINTVEVEKPIIIETVQKRATQEKIICYLNEDQSEFSEKRRFNVPVETQRQERRLKCTVENVRRESPRVLNTGVVRVKFTHEGPHDDDDGDHGRTDGQIDQDKGSRHMDSPIRDVSKQARRQDGGARRKDNKTENKKVYVREQGKITERTMEELRKAIISNEEVYFVHNGRVLMASEVNGLKHNVIVHAVR